MGIWAGIKYALNSTLGTDEFEPLDQLIINSVYLTGTNDVLYTLGNASSIDGSKTIFEKKVNISGVMRLTAEDIYDESSLNLSVYINGEYDSFMKRNTFGGGSLDFNVKKGDIIDIRIVSNYSNLSITGIKLCGTVVKAPFGGEIFDNVE